MRKRPASVSLPAWAGDALTFCGLVAYVIQALVFTHTNVSGLDEGAYLYKGYLFATGQYHPFAPGILTNKAPLAFLIPGYLQLLFGTGLRVGRLYAFLSGLLIVAGTHATARRLTNPWLAAASVWVFALSPMMIKIYSGAVTEGPVAAMLVWMLYLVLGDDRKSWHRILGGCLAGLMVLTRQNMAPVLLLLPLYLLWQYGWKTALAPFLASALVLLLGHALYWPNILRMWAPWLPSELTGWLDPFRPPMDVIASWNPSVDWIGRAAAILQGVRYHLIIVVAGVSSLILLKSRSAWVSPTRFRMFVYLAVLYFGLFALHAWAAVGSSYDFFSCVYCFAPYLGFFAPAGILLGVVSVDSWANEDLRSRVLIACIFVVILSAGVGFSAFEDIGNRLLSLPFPRVKEGGLLPGWITLWDLLSSKTSLPLALARKLVSLGAGAVGGMLIVMAAYMAWRRYRPAQGYASFLLHFTLLLSYGLAPLLAGRASSPDCRVDVIALNEEVGYHLASIIPEGSLIYWDGGLSVVPMLYLPGRKLFPPQINSGYTFVQGGDPEELIRFGYWNSELRERWLAQADFLIVEELRYAGWKWRLTASRYSEYQRTQVGTSCLEGTRLRIFRRLGSRPAAGVSKP